MMQAGNPPMAVSGLCWFMLQRIPPLVDAFAQEIDGVRQAEDIEFIHRMRVASRRLRAALPLFRGCFPPKQYGRWMAEIASITRALGEARDTDVQIAFLVKYQKKSQAAWKKQQPAEPAESPVSPAIRYLLRDLRKQRRRQQERVISALDALEKSRVIPDIRETLADRAASNRRIPHEGLAYGLPTLAAYRISSRLEALRAYEPWVTHPDAVAEHHAMRIAAKKLRYTMEVYGPVYRLGLRKHHARVKMVQEILGDLHDCDVWIDHITRILLRERSRMRSPAAGKRPDTATLASLRLFLQDREKERILIHRRFMRYWESLERAGLWEELLITLDRGRRSPYIPQGTPSRSEIITAAGILSARSGELLPHVRQVTRLALMLFDSTKPVHALGGHERLLLEVAGLLHDAGWSGGRKNHHLRGARAIIADEHLPFDLRDRVIIALCAYAHRGRCVPEDLSLFALLSPEERQAALRLSALLRLADGLDSQHRQSVKEAHCIIAAANLTCDIIAEEDVTVEKEHARTKGDLFTRAFGRDLVIR